ncbi:Tn3 family transposase [Streptosporangium sp. NPDC002544]|uniref:Tn3 family transposase n=1 Tax=Streptosporangium sp. NPDC002544 TaxID=3154538 RepID=UPI0033226DFD
MPTEVIDFLAGQLGIADPSCVKRYSQREPTHREHAGKIQKALGLKDFAEVEAELAVSVGRRAWVTGDGPKAIFVDALHWLREHDVLLPGASRLARLVVREREAATQRLWQTLYGALSGQQRLALDALLVVPPGSRVSELERWRMGPARASGPQMVKALNRVAEIIGSGFQALNVGYGPVSSPGVPALDRRRIGHAGRTYLRAAGYTAANPHLIAQQTGIAFAQALGGGMVAAIDGMRFVVPVPSLMAKPNRKYFGPKRGITWLNQISDQAFGTGHKIVAGTDRDCLHAIDLFFSSGTANLPEVLVTDTGSYSDLAFGLASLLGVEYRPALADLPDQKGWRTDNGADYGSLNTFARGKLDLGKVRRHWGEILRLIATIYTSKVSASDVVVALQRGGRPTALGEAIATYGRIFKTLHILSVVDSEPYRRGIKGMRNLQEGRHALAEKIFHGRRREVFQRYREGMEDQLGALGIVLNCVVLWNTVYIDAALNRLHAQGYGVRDEDRPPQPLHAQARQRPREIFVRGPGAGRSRWRRHRHPAVARPRRPR